MNMTLLMVRVGKSLFEPMYFMQMIVLLGGLTDDGTINL